MTVSRTVTYQQTVPHRPAEDDVLAGTKTNATPTVPPSMLSAEEYEQMARLVVAHGKMSPVLRVSVTGHATTPTVHSFACVRSDVLIGDIVVAHNSQGVVSVTVAGKFPAPATKPMASTNAGAVGIADAIPITNGVQVRTYDAAGVLQDLSFTVEIF